MNLSKEAAPNGRGFDLPTEGVYSVSHFRGPQEYWSGGAWQNESLCLLYTA